MSSTESPLVRCHLGRGGEGKGEGGGRGEGLVGGVLSVLFRHILIDFGSLRVDILIESAARTFALRPNFQCKLSMYGEKCANFS